VFSIDGCRFALSRTGGDAVFHLPLGELKAMVPLATVRAQHVKEIRPGDSIPRELLDGTASWSVEERHRAVARGRLSLQILSWMSGWEESGLGSAHHDSAQLARLTESPEVRARVTDGMARLALELGYGEGETAQQAVVAGIEGVARELAYLEALRERVATVAGLVTKLQSAGRLYRREQTTVDEIRRMLVLIRPPLAAMQESLVQADAQSGEVLGMLRNLVARVRHIRAVRDGLHGALMPWDEIIAAWHDEQPVARDAAFEALLRKTYGFLAGRFVQTDPWKRRAT
jgi:hypothetical protein